MYATPRGLNANFQPIEFADILATNHSYSISAQIEDPWGKPLLWGFAITGGGVSVDRSAQHRRQLSMQIKPYMGTDDIATAVAGSLIPETAADPLAPYGNLIRAWYSIPIPGYTNPETGTSDYPWGLGLFRLSTADIADDGVPVLSITGFDLSRTISRNRLTQPWIVAAGTNFGAAIIALAKSRYPQLKARAHTVTDVTAQFVIEPEEDPWRVITSWASSIGYEAYFDAEGYLVITPEPDPTNDPICWTYGDGGAMSNALIQALDRSMTDEPGYNGVVMTSESSTIPAPLRSEVWDTNPSSPTYANGAYGKVPKFVSNPYVITQGQCDRAAQAELLRSLGGTERVSMSVVPNPAHEAGDIIRVVRPLSKTDKTSVLESFDIPFSPGDAQSLTCRERRTL